MAPCVLGQGRVHTLTGRAGPPPSICMMNMKATSSIISKAFSASIFFSHYRGCAPCPEALYSLTFPPGLLAFHPSRAPPRLTPHPPFSHPWLMASTLLSHPKLHSAEQQAKLWKADQVGRGATEPLFKMLL